MNEKGFTLIELIIAIVLLGIIGSVGIALTINVFRGYIDSKMKNFLFLEAKFTVERIDREIRNAIPNTIRTNGSYLQYILLNDGFFYSNISSDNITVYQDNFSSFAKVGDYISIYNLRADDIYNSTNQKKYKISNIREISQDNWSVILENSIIRNSPYYRLFLIKTPVTIYKEGDKLKRCFGYDINSSNGIGEGICNVLSSYVKNVEFAYQPGTNRRNAIVKIGLTYEKNGITLNYSHEVHLRNVP